MPDTAVTDAKNVHFDTMGKAKLREGVTLLGSQVSNNYSCLGLYDFQASNASNSQLLAVFSDGTNNDVYYNNAGTWTKTLEDDTKGLKTRFTTFLDQVIRVNGTDNATAWAGTGAWSQNAGTGANDLNLDDMDSNDCNLIESYKARVYMAGDSNFKDRLYYSAVATTDPYITFTPATGFVDINPNDGENITALKRYALDLLILKNNFLYRYRALTGLDPEPIINVGTYSQESVIITKVGAMFHHPTGIYIYNGKYPQEISRPVADFIDAVPLSYYDDVSAWVDHSGDHAYFSIGDVTVDGISWTNVVLRYTISTEVWTVYSYGTELKRGVVYKTTSAQTTVVGDDDGNIFTLNSGTTDNTAVIPYHMTTKFYELGAVAESFILNKICAVCENAQGIQLAYQLDDENKLNNKPWHTLGELKRFLTYFNNKEIKGHRIRFKIYGGSSVSPFAFEGIEFLKLINKGIKE
jgi:hypothetical protein